MSGGTSSTSQQANGQTSFNPTSIGGGNIMVGGSVGNGPVSQGSQSSATGPSVGLDLSMPMPMGLMNLQGLQGIQVIDLQSLKSEYVPYGPSAGEGWQTDLGDAITDTSIAGATAYKTYKASQPAIDAIWKLIDPKSHAAAADKTFQAINDVKEVGKSMGGWKAFGDFGQEIAGRPPAPTQNYLNPSQPQQAAAEWQQADEAGYLWYWAPTQQFYDSYYQLYYDPQSQLYYDGQGGQWTPQQV